MYTLTREQKLANLKELIEPKKRKIQILQGEVEVLERKIQKLEAELTTQKPSSQNPSASEGSVASILGL